MKQHVNKPDTGVRVEFTLQRRTMPLRSAGEASEPMPERIPRISKLMALAIKFDGLLRDGVVKDYADLARLGGVSRARITQIMHLLNLATGIQEELLFLRVDDGRTGVNFRKLTSIVLWDEQSWLEATR